MSRSRRIIVHSKRHSKEENCPSLSETEVCNTQKCPDPIDCEVSEWTSWTACSKTCGGGEKSRSRVVTVEMQHFGIPCPALSATEPCLENCDCPVDCVEGTWDAWPSCSETCGTTGAQSRRRTILVHSSAASTHAECPHILAGRQCEATFDKRNCNRHACPVDCEVGQWSSWTVCSLTCSEPKVMGATTRSRELIVDVDHGGKTCPTLTETNQCNEGRCPIHCEVSLWSSWSQCTKSCQPAEGTAGTRHRSRTIVQHAMYGGYVCPELTETPHCNEVCCPVNCVEGEWTKFGTYPGGGMNLKRTRPRVVAPSCGGISCPALEELKIFHHPDCNKELVGPASECSKTCGDDGYQIRMHEFIRCGGAAIRLHVRYNKHELCNRKACETEEEKNQPHKPIVPIEVNTNVREADMSLVESVGNWVPVSQDEIHAYSLLEEPGMQKWQPSA